MGKRQKKWFLITVFLAALTGLILLMPALTFAQGRSVQDILTQGLIRPPANNGVYEISDFFLLLAAVLRLIFTGTALIAVIYLILGGYAYVTAYGNPEAAEKGKLTITWAIIGLIVSIAAFIIVQFVWNTVARGEPPSPTGTTTPATTTP